jgi:hypothetical protein
VRHDSERTGGVRHGSKTRRETAARWSSLREEENGGGGFDGRGGREAGGRGGA